MMNRASTAAVVLAALGLLVAGGSDFASAGVVVEGGILYLSGGDTINDPGGITVYGDGQTVANVPFGGSTVRTGLLRVDVTGVADRLGPTPVILHGGGFLLDPSGHTPADVTRTVASVTAASGANSVYTAPKGGGVISLEVGDLNRNAGATVDFRSQWNPLGGTWDCGRITVTNLNGSPIANDAGGILGGWAVTHPGHGHNNNSNDFATYTPTGVQPFTGYYHGFPGAGPNDVVYNDTWTSLPTDTTVHALRSHNADVVLGGNDLIVNSGGIIISGNNHWIRDGGGLTSGAPGGELFLTVNDGGTDYAIYRVWIQDNWNTGTPVSFIKSGPGKLKLKNDMWWTGPTHVNEGTLEANFSWSGYGVFNGTPSITVGPGATLRSTANEAMGWRSPLPEVILNKGTWTIAPGLFDYAGDVTMTGGTVTSDGVGHGGYNTNWFMGDNTITTLPSSVSSVVSAQRIRGGGTTTFDVADGPAADDLVVSSVLWDYKSAKSVVKTGAGTLALTGANTYTGNTTVSGGVLDLTGGSIYNGGYNLSRVTVESGGTLRVGSLAYGDGNSLGQLTYNAYEIWQPTPTAGSPVPSTTHLLLDDGTLEVAGGTHTTGHGFIVTSNGGTVEVTNPATTLTIGTRGGDYQDLYIWGPLTLGGAGNGVIQDKRIRGTGSLIKTGTGTWTLRNGNNTYTGLTRVDNGTLEAGGAFGGDGGIQGDITINSGGTFKLLQSNIIKNTSLITVNAGGTFDANGQSEAYAYLAGGGAVTNFSTTFELDLGGAGPQTFSGSITGSGGLLRVRGNNGGGAQILTGTAKVGGIHVHRGSSGTTALELAGTGTTAVSGGVGLGYGGSGTAQLNVKDDHTLTIGGSLLLGEYSGNGGTVNQSGGTVTIGGETRIGHWSNETSTYTLSGTATTELVANGVFNVGWDGTGIFTQTGGTSALNGGLAIRALGTVELGGNGKSTASWIGMGYSGNGAMLRVKDTHALTIGGNLLLGEYSGNGGTVDQSGGTVTIGGETRIAHWGSETSTYTLSGTGSLTATGLFSVGWDGTGIFTQTGGISQFGTLRVNDTMTLSAGRAQASALQVSERSNGGVLNIDGGMLTAGYFGIGEYSSRAGTVTQTAGDVTVDGQMKIGHWSNETSTYNMDGGTLTVKGGGTGPEQAGVITIGIDGTGILNHSAGTIATQGLFLDARGATGGLDQYNMTGGTLEINGSLGIAGNANTSTYQINLGGGTVKSNASWSRGTPMTLTGTNGSVTFDTIASNTVTLSGVLSGPGGLVKNGAGNLILTARNTYAGDTTVNKGTLILDAPNSANSVIGTGTLTINPGATVETAVNGFGWTYQNPIVIDHGTLLSFGADSHLNTVSMTGGLVSGLEFRPHANFTINASPDTQDTAVVDVNTLNLQNTITFHVADGPADPALRIDSRITGGHSIAKQGGGTMMVTNPANSYGGETLVQGGVLQLGAANVIPDSSQLDNRWVGTGTLDLNGYDEGILRLGGNIAITNTGPGTPTFSIGTNNGSGWGHGGPISGTMSLVKTGTGWQQLEGMLTYTGTTTVSGGELRLMDTHTGGDDYTVGKGGTLGGTGATASHVIVQQGGTLAPDGDLGTGELDLEPLSFLTVGLDALDAFDSVMVTGTVDVTDARLEVRLGYAPEDGDYFVIVDNDGDGGDDAVIGHFLDLPEGAELVPRFDGQPYGFWISYQGGDGNDIALIAVPEPTTLSLLGLGALAALLRRRRQRA